MIASSVPDLRGARWHLPIHLRARLMGPDGFRLDEWLQSGVARPIKHGPLRTVYRVVLPGLDFHVKHYRPVGLRSRLRESLRPVKARSEYEQAFTLRTLGVPTPEPLGWGVIGPTWSPTASLLLTRTIDARPLLDFLEHELPSLPAGKATRLRQRLAVGLAGFLARMHAARVMHHDLHPGNLIVRWLDEHPELSLIDLHAVRIGGHCSWCGARENLALFNRYFALRADRSDRLRFWTAYHAARRDSIGVPFGAAARDLEDTTELSNVRLWTARDGRSCWNNRYYRRIGSGLAGGHAVRDLDPAVLARLLADPAGALSGPGVQVLKDSSSSTVVEFDLRVDGVCQRVILKRFRADSRRSPWLGLVRRSAALRSWVAGHGLRERRLPTPRPLAVWHVTVNGLPGDGYLLTLKVPDSVPLAEFVRLRRSQPARLRPCLERLARLIGDLHRRRLAHRDLKAANLLVSGDDRDPRPYLIDLVSVIRSRRPTRRLRIRDLARLHASFHRDPAVSRSDKLRFLRLYLQANLRGAGGWKRWWREIAGATAAKVERNRRRGRPLA